MNETEDFIQALTEYVRSKLSQGMETDYCTEAVKVVDARNHLFRTVENQATDEAEDIYALRDLCRVDEETMDFSVDYGRLASVARNFFG